MDYTVNGMNIYDYAHQLRKNAASDDEAIDIAASMIQKCDVTHQQDHIQLWEAVLATLIEIAETQGHSVYLH